MTDSKTLNWKKCYFQPKKYYWHKIIIFIIFIDLISIWRKRLRPAASTLLNKRMQKVKSSWSYLNYHPDIPLVNLRKILENLSEDSSKQDLSIRASTVQTWILRLYSLYHGGEIDLT